MPSNHTHDPDIRLNYDYIDDGIYIGSSQCCTVGLADIFKKEDIGTVIDLRLEQLSISHDVKNYVWLPTQNMAPPSSEDLISGVQALEASVADGKRSYVHCANGMSRAPTLVGAYLIKVKGMTTDQAISFIKSKRPVAYLSVSQERVLREFEATLKQ